MYHENRNLIHQIIFVLCILFSLISPPYNQGVAGGKETKTTSGSMATGVVETIQNNGKTDTKKTKFILIKPNRHDGLVGKTPSGTIGNERNAQCNQECKINTLIGLGIREEIASPLVMNCKALADNPVRCIKIGAFITIAESGGGKNCKKSNKYNCFGLSVQEDYKSYNDGVLHFIGKYNRFWHKQTNPNGFYSNSPDWKPATRFCLSEHSSGLPYCKNGHRIAWSVFNKLNF